LVIVKPSSVSSTSATSLGINRANITLNGSVVFFNCASLSLNNVFTSTFDHYMVIVRNSYNTVEQGGTFRLRANGTDNTTANSYTRQQLTLSSTSVYASRASGDLYFWNDIGQSPMGSTFFIYGPAKAEPTVARSSGLSSYSNSTFYHYGFTHNQSTSYDGFTISSNFTSVSSGLITVYGMGV
jgi:hypothetical protein